MRRVVSLFITLCSAGLAACSASAGGGEFGTSRGDTTASQSNEEQNPEPEGAGGSSGGTIETGGSGSGGSSTGGGGSGSGPEAQCQAVSLTAQNKLLPTDIIVAVDQSGSMGDETKWVQAQLNGFSQQIMASGVDVRVVLIAERPGGPVGEHPICVPPPLGGAGCSDNAPTFTQVNQHVDSHDALAQILKRYPSYSGVLRPEAQKHVIVISDDESSVGALDFDVKLRALGAPMFDNYVFHAIVAVTDCDEAADDGKQYMKLVQMRAGVLGDLCKQAFQPVWDEVSKQVEEGTTLACEWDIPDPPANEQFDPDLVNVVYTVNGVQRELGRVASAADCPNFKDAWYYDDPANPTKILACPDVCAELQAAGSQQQIDIGFGCTTRQSNPK